MKVNQKGDILKEENNRKVETYKLCERCKNKRANLFCEKCKPFHFFCNQCDAAIHELPSRKNHGRTHFDSFRDSTFMKKSIEDVTTNNRYYSPRNYPYKSLSLNNNNNDNDNYNYNYDNDLNNSMPIFIFNSPKNGLKTERCTYDYNFNGKVGIGADECRKVYSKDYVNELNKIHDKEKEELKYKITTLENTINRYKSSLNEQITNVRRAQDLKDKESNNKIEKMKMEYQFKINSMEKEKDFKEKEIIALKQKISEQLKINEKILATFDELKENYCNLQNEYDKLNNDYIMIEKITKKECEIMNQKLISTMDEFENYKAKCKSDIQNIINANNKNLNDLMRQKEIEIKELNMKHEETLKNEIDYLKEKYERIINDANNENNILRQDNVVLVQKLDNLQTKMNEDTELYQKNINLLENENLSKTQNIKDLEKQLEEENIKNIELEKVISDLNNENNQLKKNLNEKTKVNENLEEKISFLNNELKNLNEFVSRKINKLKDDYNTINIKYGCSSPEFENKLKNSDFFEDINNDNMLGSENEKLKNKNDNNYLKPKSLTYVFSEK